MNERTIGAGGSWIMGEGEGVCVCGVEYGGGSEIRLLIVGFSNETWH
jgi:hypothetical protein